MRQNLEQRAGVEKRKERMGKLGSGTGEAKLMPKIMEGAGLK